MAYLVVINRPYYPSVQRFDSKTEAELEYAEIVGKVFDPGGDPEVSVYLVEVIQETRGDSDLSWERSWAGDE